jgi:two-component system LytT family response regulator
MSGKIKAVIVDDEQNARETLRNIIGKYFDDITILGEADDVQAGVEMIEKQQPQVVFLDIQMPSGNGFDLLMQLSEINFHVIFTTAFDNYAIRAFKFSAFDYLLKPIKIKDMRETIDRLKLEMDNAKSPHSRLKVLIDNYSNTDGKIKKLVIPSMEGFEVVKLEDIIRCEGERNYTRVIISESNNILVSRTLKEYEELLSDHGFFRIHQSSLINLHHVKKYLKGGGGRVEMTDGVELTVSRYRKEAFVKRFL